MPAAEIAAYAPGDQAFVADPYPSLAALREATPVFFHEPSNQWVLTRFADVHETLRNRRLGRAFAHRYSPAEFGRPEPDGRWADFEAHERWSLLSLEPPAHTEIRRLIAAVFTPRAVEQRRVPAQDIAEALLDGCSERRSASGSFDLLADYAQPFSVAVICALLGVPRADTGLLLDWSHAIVKMYELTLDDERRRLANRAAREFMAYTQALIDEKRRAPDGLLVSELAAVEDGGVRLTDAQILSTVMVLLEAGHEATVNTLGNGVRALMHHRGQWDRLVDAVVPARVAVEELIRYDAPLQLFERWVLEEGVVIAGQRMAVGEEVAMLFGSANRDPRRFDVPEAFDVGRGDTGHIGFGGGIHFCVGAPLARLELEVSLSALVHRFPKLELVVEPVYHPTFVIRGLTAVLVA